jgi:hypothetical protein
MISIVIPNSSRWLTPIAGLSLVSAASMLPGHPGYLPVRIDDEFARDAGVEALQPSGVRPRLELDDIGNLLSSMALNRSPA